MSSYASITDTESRVNSRDLVNLTDETAQAVNTTVLQNALNDASIEIDSHLEGRFSLPFIDPPAILVQVCVDIAVYRLNTIRPQRDGEDIRKRYEDRVAWLKRVARGEAGVGLTADSKEPAIAQQTTVLQQSRALTGGLFGRTLRGF